MNNLYQIIEPVAAGVAVLISLFNLRLLWKIYTNHLPHIWEALRRIAAKEGIDISDLS